VRLGRRLHWRRGDLLQLLANRQAEKASTARPKASTNAACEPQGSAATRSPADRQKPPVQERLIRRRAEPT
jgi:hypothetical protein